MALSSLRGSSDIGDMRLSFRDLHCCGAEPPLSWRRSDGRDGSPTWACFDPLGPRLHPLEVVTQGMWTEAWMSPSLEMVDSPERRLF